MPQYVTRYWGIVHARKDDARISVHVENIETGEPEYAWFNGSSVNDCLAQARARFGALPLLSAQHPTRPGSAA